MTSSAPPAWQQLALLQRLPACVRRVLVAAPFPEALVAELGAQSRQVTAAASVAEVLTETGQSVEGPFDCVAVAAEACGELPLRTVLGQLEAKLGPRGYFAVFGARNEVLTQLAACRLAVYARWETPNLAQCLCIVVREDYNPLEHARELFAEGHAGLSYDLLNRIPESYLADAETTAVVAIEKQLCLLAWDNTASERGRMVRFYNALYHFYAATAALPGAVESYHCQAEFWHRIGDDGMARRLLETIQHAAPSEGAARQLQRFTGAASRRPDTACPAPPEWRNNGHPPRVLFVTHLRPDYGLDTLYDGLCSELGDENVVEFPHKPTLHGEIPKEQAHYPCMFNRSGASVSYADLLSQLQDGRFDLVLFGDTEHHLADEQARGIARAAGNIPFCIVDQADTPHDQRAAMLAWLGRDSITAYFKRECLTAAEYGPNGYPLPFSYSGAKALQNPAEDHRAGVFWAGHRLSGLRRLYLEQLENKLGLALGERYEQDAYRDALSGALIGLNFFGFGFDTVRYWELPAHGCLLIAEALPIHVPHNFVDGESAVFFHTLPELEQKVQYYLDHPGEAQAIGLRGHEHFLRFHTASARARQLLAWTEAALGRPLRAGQL